MVSKKGLEYPLRCIVEQSKVEAIVPKALRCVAFGI